MAAEAEMEFGSLKRKELQALCKKYGIPANKTNREMVLRLTEALKVNEPPATQSPDEDEDLEEENDTGVPMQGKRVRFSPEVETREYEPTARKQKGRVTRANAKAMKTNPDVHVDEPSKNSEKDGSRKLVQECAELGKVGKRGKSNAPKGTDFEPMLVTGSKSSEVSGRMTRRRARSQSTCNTSAVNKEEDCCEVIVVGESSEGVKRYPSRRQCVVTQADKFGNAEEELKGRTSKRSSKGELQGNMDAQASADAKVDKTEKASAAAGYPRRSRRKTAVSGTSNVELGGNTDAEASEDSKQDDIEKVSAPVANSRRSRRNTVVLGTINQVDEVGDDESVVVQEIPKPVTRKSSRQKSGVLQEENFEGAEEKLKGKAGKVPSKSKFETIMVDEASVVDNLQKVSAPIRNLRSSRRKTTIDEAQKAEVLVVEESAKAVDRNSSDWNGSDTNELKRKADKLLSYSGLEVIMEAEPSATSKENIAKAQKAPLRTVNLRRSGRRTLVSSPISADNAVGNVKAVGSACQVGELVSENDVQPVHESRRISNETVKTTDAVGEIELQSRKSGVLQEEKFEGAEETLKDKASKVPSKSKFEKIMVDEASVASVVDNLQKVSAPTRNLRRSRRKTTIDEAQNAEAFEVEESAKDVNRNSSGRNGSDTKELKRKADKLLSYSGLEVIMEVEPSARSKENIVKPQKPSLRTVNLRRSGRRTLVSSPISADNAVGNVKAVGSACQVDELVSENDVQPVHESRRSSKETGKTTDAVGEIELQSRKGKRARHGTRVVKRESVVGKSRQSARVNSKSSKAGSSRVGKTAEEQHTTIKLPVIMEANKYTENIVPVEESPIEVVDIGPSGSAQNKCSVDSRNQMERTPSAASSKLVGSSTNQGLPRVSAVSAKTHAEVIEETNVGSVSIISEEKLELLHSSGAGVCLVSPERNKSSERIENVKEISGEVSFKLVGTSMDEETAGSSRKPVSTSRDCHQQMGDFAIEDDKDVQLGQSLEMSEDLNHGNSGRPEQPKIETRASDVDNLSSEDHFPLAGEFSSSLEFKEGKERKELLTWNCNGNEDQSIERNKKSVPDLESLVAEALLNQGEITLGHKFPQEGEELVIEVSAKLLKTNKCHDFSLDDEMNVKGGNPRSSKLDEVQTGETSGLKCLMEPIPTFPEHRDNSLEANDAYEAACAQEISNQASETAIASGEKDIEASDIRSESSIFTDWELNLIQGNGNQDEVVELDKQSMKDRLICNDLATLMTENSAISEEAEVQVAQMEVDATDGAPKKWEENKSPINQTVASRQDETFDLPKTYSSGQDMMSPKLPIDDLQAGRQGTLGVHEYGAGGAPEEFGSLTAAEHQSEKRYSAPGMSTGGSSLTGLNILTSPRTNCTEVPQLPVEVDSNKMKDILDGSDDLNRLSFENGTKCLVGNASSVCNDHEQAEEIKVSEKNIQLISKETVDSSGVSTNGASFVDGETEPIGLNLVFEGQDEEADTAEADDRALLNDDSRVLQEHQAMSKQVAAMERDTTDGVSKKLENSSPLNQTVDNCVDGTLDIHHMFSPGHDIMSPKAAPGGSVGVTETFNTHTPQSSLDELKARSVQCQRALDIHESEVCAPEEFESERSYAVPGMTGNVSSLTLQSVPASPSSNDIENFQLPREAEGSKLTETDDCQKVTESVQIPEGSFREGQKELQEVGNEEVTLDGTDCLELNCVSIKNDHKSCAEEAAEREDCSLTIGEEVEASGREENTHGSFSNCEEQFLHNQGSTIPSVEVSSMNMEKVVDGVCDHLANEEAEECPVVIMSGDLSCCKDAAVNKNEEENFTQVPCQDSVTAAGQKMQLMLDGSIHMKVLNLEETVSEMEDPCDQKEAAKVLDADEDQDFCGGDEMNEKGGSSRSLKFDEVETARTWVPGSTFSECSRDSPSEANDADLVTCAQEISNQANENAFASPKGTNATEFFQLPGLAGGDKLTDIEEPREATETESMDVCEAAANEADSSLDITQELAKNRLSIENGFTSEEVEETKVLENIPGLSSNGASFVHGMAEEKNESMGLNKLFEGQDGEPNQVTMTRERKASSSPAIAEAAHNDEATTEELQESEPADDASITSSPFCIPLANSFAPLSLDMSPGSATMEVDKLPPPPPLSLSSSPPQNTAKDGAAIDDRDKLRSAQIRQEVEDGRGEVKQENLPWCSELKMLGSPKVPRTPLVQDAPSGSLMDVKLPPPSSTPTFKTTRKPKVSQRTTGKIFGGNVMKENAGGSKLDMQRQQLGNVTAPPKTLGPAATRRRPLQDLASTRRND